jgi:lysylphosphatidylglycerol synthetase-like protein (DUF2156 family)
MARLRRYKSKFLPEWNPATSQVPAGLSAVLIDTTVLIWGGVKEERHLACVARRI